MRRDETEPKRRFGAADALLLLAVVGLLLGGAFLWIRREKGRPVEAICVLRVTVLRTEQAQDALPKVDDLVRNGSGTVTLGRVIAVEEAPHRRLSAENGQPVWITDEERVDWEITVSLSGRLREGEGLRVEDTRIAAGSDGVFRIGGFYAANARMIEVEVLES